MSSTGENNLVTFACVLLRSKFNKVLGKVQANICRLQCLKHKLMRTRVSRHVFIKRPYSNNTSVLKEYRGSYGVRYIHLFM